MNISIVLPAYKEGKNLRTILPKLNDVMRTQNLSYEILVVDTMEPMDDAAEVCRELGATYINRTGGNFYGDAIRTGINKAQGTYLVIMDADGSHDPKYIPKFLEKHKRTNCDLVIGSRYIEGGDSFNGPVSRLMSKTLNLTYRLVFDIYAKDISDSFRLYKSEQIKSLQLQCSNFDIVEEILIQLVCKYKNFKIVEVPIMFNKRVHGESKRDLVKFIFSYLQTMKRLYGIKRRMEKQRLKLN